jgi:hypothetical protein
MPLRETARQTTRQSSLLYFSQLLLKFTKYPSPITVVVDVTEEMALRISASPGTSDYGALTLIVQLHYRVDCAPFRGVFFPSRTLILPLSAYPRAPANCRTTRSSSGSSGADFHNVEAAADLLGKRSQIGRSFKRCRV